MMLFETLTFIGAALIGAGIILILVLIALTIALMSDDE
jgi:hypothetical protein